MDTVARGEMAEASIDAFISKRDKQRRKQEGERPAEDPYMESTRRYQERQRRQNVAAWFAHFCRMAENHRSLAEHYEGRAEELCEEGEQ